MTPDQIQTLNKRLLDIISCRNQGTKYSRLQTLLEDIQGFNCLYANWLRKTVQEEMEGLR